MQTIEIMGAIDACPHYNPSYLLSLLDTGVQALRLGSDFVGRPGTQIHANRQDVIKIRNDVKLPAPEAREWIQQTLQIERQMAVHHPHKTWLLISADTQNLQIASVCPRLSPLHVALKSGQDQQRNLALLSEFFKLYLNLAHATGKKLDEGLSNFGVSAEGQVYYLDDEYYAWDDFVALAVMLGVFIRTFSWFDQAFINALGSQLLRILAEIFDAPDSPSIIARHLQPLFMPNAEKEQLQKQLVNMLLLSGKRPSIPFAPLPTAAKPIISQEVATKPPKKQTKGRFLALLADIHANYAALSCVLDYLNTEGIGDVLVLGDIVGYGPEPQACIERLQNSRFQIIKGNHDHAAATGDVPLGFSKDAQTVIAWTNALLSAEQRAWLEQLPLFLQQENWYAVHGAPMDKSYFNAYVYLMTYQDNLDYMQQHNMPLCFHGHSHMPGVFARRLQRDVTKSGPRVNLLRYQHKLVCPGSVGQPRNGSTATQFAIYDRQQDHVSFINLPYDHESVIAKMHQQQLPDGLSLRLQRGR